MRRFERPTCRLGGGCSILLSYMGLFTFSNAPPIWRNVRVYLGGGRSILLSYVGTCCVIVNENRAGVKRRPGFVVYGYLS